MAPARVAVLASGTAEWSAARDPVMLVVRATALGAADPLVRCAAGAGAASSLRWSRQRCRLATQCSPAPPAGGGVA